MLTAFSQRELVERARDAGALAYVVKPFTRADLVPAIEIALSRHAELVALEAEVADLAERFETRKRVDRAKSMLMTSLGLTEPDAFRWIQKTSMDRRLSMREVADAVLSGIPGVPASASSGASAGERSRPRPEPAAKRPVHVCTRGRAVCNGMVTTRSTLARGTAAGGRSGARVRVVLPVDTTAEDSQLVPTGTARHRRNLCGPSSKSACPWWQRRWS